MLKLVAGALSILFCVQMASADMVMIRNAVCRHDNKNYILLVEQKAVGLVANQEYIIMEKDTADTQKMPRTLQGSFPTGGADLIFPSFWRPTSIPLNSCQAETPKLHLFSEVIREFYVKTYFLAGDPRAIQEDIEDLVKRGDAIPLKMRVLCKSDDFTDDITLCHELTLLDKLIPIDPNER
ncbi:hypothetical protein [Bdellovibrio sp. HCB337]|uniref:hypothetical protein n=1 Tax=Bdellovibrio sp. HCB337 TaxID=3394358 RepID=UPI0039A6C1FF